MAVTNTPIFPQTIKNAAVLINNATGTATVTLYTGGTNGSKIESIAITSTDTSARVLNIILTVSAVDYQIGTINVPIAAGTDAAATVSVSVLENNSMMPHLRKDSNGRTYLFLGSGTILKFSTQVTVTAAKQINIVAQLGDY
jgi:hypothetical protein